jgi:hypothetical protein
MAAPGTETPTFGKAATHFSDVQFRHVLSPDDTSNAILFDNFTIRLEAGDPPVAVRTLSIVFPLAGISNETELRLDLRGALVVRGGATGTVIVRALGGTHTWDTLLDPADPDSSNFMRDLALKVPAGRNLDLTLILVAERDTDDPDGAVLIGLDSADMSLGNVGGK